VDPIGMVLLNLSLYACLSNTGQSGCHGDVGDEENPERAVENDRRAATPCVAHKDGGPAGGRTIR